MNSTVAGVVLGAGLLGAVAQADLAVDLLSGSLYVRGTWANFGYSIEVHEPVRVNALGLWDYQGNGLAEEHEVGIWDASGNLLAQALVDNNGWAVTGALAGHAWRFVDIAPIDLAPGEYKLGAFYRTTADPFVANGDNFPCQITLAPQITYGQSYVTTGGTEFFTEPNTATSINPGYFGPNANIIPIPEPATLAGMLIVGLFGLRRRG